MPILSAKHAILGLIAMVVACDSGECTTPPCRDAAGVIFEKSTEWEPGDYHFILTVGDDVVECQASLPIVTGKAACPDDAPAEIYAIRATEEESNSGKGGGAGAAPMLVEDRFDAIVYFGTPEELTLEIRYEDETMAAGDFEFEDYNRFYTTGSECDPGCIAAEARMELD